VKGRIGRWKKLSYDEVESLNQKTQKKRSFKKGQRMGKGITPILALRSDDDLPTEVHLTQSKRKTGKKRNLKKRKKIFSAVSINIIWTRGEG